MKIVAALFDLDGTLLDSMGVWRRVDELFLSARGFAVPEDYQRTIAALRMADAARYTVERFGLNETPEALLGEWLELARGEYAHNVPLKPHAKACLVALKRAGLKLGTASSLTRELYEPALRRCGIYDLFDAFTSAAHSPRGKAYPDVYLAACAKLDVSPANCAMYDDLPDALAGAKAAGLYTVGVFDESSRAQTSRIMEIADRYIPDFSNEAKALLSDINFRA